MSVKNNRALFAGNVGGGPRSADVFLTGASGYLGRHLGPELIRRGYHVHALVRGLSAHRLDARCRVVVGDPLDSDTFADAIPARATVVHLVGVARPTPAKAAEFRSVDLQSTGEVLEAALTARASHFVYISVAQPSPVMREYVQARQDAEHMIRASGLPATFLRPWYVLGPGRRWPLMLIPLYRILELIPRTRESARRLGFVGIGQMTEAIASAVDNPPAGVRIIEVPEIRALGKRPPHSS